MVKIYEYSKTLLIRHLRDCRGVETSDMAKDQDFIQEMLKNMEKIEKIQKFWHISDVSAPFGTSYLMFQHPKNAVTSGFPKHHITNERSFTVSVINIWDSFLP